MEQPSLDATQRKTGTVVHETERLILRRFDVADAPFILRLLNEPGFLRYIGDRGVRTLADAEAYIVRGPLASYERLGFGLLLVQLKEGSEAVGMCGLMQKPWLESPDIAYAFLTEAGGNGYASEAARAVMDHAHRGLALPRVLAVVTPDNSASIRLLEKVGFRAEGTIVDPARTELRLYVSSARAS